MKFCNMLLVFFSAYNAVLALKFASDKVLVDLAKEFGVKRVLFLTDGGKQSCVQNFQTARHLMNFGLYIACFHSDNFQQDPVCYSRSLVVFRKLQETAKNASFLSDLNISNKYIWINFGDDEILDITYVPMDTIFLSLRTRSIDNLLTEDIDIFESFETCSNGTVWNEPVGTWSYHIGIDFTRISSFDRRSNAFGCPIRVIPYRKDDDGGLATQLPNFYPAIWDDIINRLNLTSVVDAENWDIDLNFDNSLSLILPPIFRVTMKLFYKEMPLEMNYGNYFTPFSTMTWGVIFGILILMASALSASAFHLKKQSNCYIHILDGFYVLSQQDAQSYVDVESLASLLLSYTRLIFSVLIYSLYACVMYAFITVTIEQPLFTSFEDIHQNGRYNIISPITKGYAYLKVQPPGTILNLLFRERTDPIELQPLNFDEGVRKICFSERRLLLSMSSELIGTYMINYPQCHLGDHPVALVKLPKSWDLKPNNPFGGMIKVCVTRLIESGSVLDTGWKKLILRKYPVEERFTPITWSKIIPLLAMYAIGILVSVLFLIGERIDFHVGNRKEYVLDVGRHRPKRLRFSDS